jgi:hypothetical protein
MLIGAPRRSRQKIARKPEFVRTHSHLGTASALPPCQIGGAANVGCHVAVLLLIIFYGIVMLGLGIVHLAFY